MGENYEKNHSKIYSGLYKQPNGVHQSLSSNKQTGIYVMASTTLTRAVIIRSQLLQLQMSRYGVDDCHVLHSHH